MTDTPKCRHKTTEAIVCLTCHSVLFHGTWHQLAEESPQPSYDIPSFDETAGFVDRWAAERMVQHATRSSSVLDEPGKQSRADNSVLPLGQAVSAPGEAPELTAAQDKFLAYFGELIDDATERMPHEEFMKMAAEANAFLDEALKKYGAEKP